MSKTTSLVKPRVLHVDTFSAPNAKPNVEGMTRAYNKVAIHRPFDYRRIATKRGAQVMNKELVNVASEFKPQLIHMGKCELVEGKTIRVIRERLGESCTVVHFYGDYRIQVQPWVASIGKHADWTLLQHADPGQMRAYRAAGCRQVGTWLAATDPVIFYPHKVKKQYDVVFMANHSPIHVSIGANRVVFLKALTDAGLTVDVFGRGWPKWPGMHLHSYVSSEHFAHACSAACIAINYSTTRAYLYTSWPRVFNTMASGCFFITRYFPGLETLFEHEKHLVWFKKPQQAVKHIKRYLKDDRARNRIAQAGMKQVLSNHTWDHRIAQMMGYIT